MKIIDIHTHGIGGFDTRTNNPEDILAIAAIQGSHGVSEIVPTIYSAAIQVMRAHMETVRKAMERQKNVSNAYLSANNPPAQITGIHLEGPFLNPVKSGALDPLSFSLPDEDILKELLDGFEDIVKIMTVAPEIRGAVGIIKKISGMGIVVSMGHSDATYSQAEAGFQAGARGMTHIFNAMRGIHHREPGIVGFGLLNRDIYIELIADPYHLHPRTLDLVFKIKNHDRILLVSDTVENSGTATDGVKGITDSAGKISGGSMTITEASQRLIQMGYDEEDIIDCITENPERYLQGQ